MTRLAQPAGTVRHLAVARAADRSWALPVPSSDNVTTATSRRAQVAAVASATPHTKGAWVEVIAATTRPANVVDIVLAQGVSTGGVNSSALLDIGIGAGGSEVVIASNLAVGYRITLSDILAGGRELIYRLPLRVPAASRVALALQGAEVSKSVAFSLTFGYVASFSSSGLVTIGADTATSRGVTVTAPGALNTKGAWTQIVASTAQPFVALAAGFQGAGNTAFGPSGNHVLVDIGIGGAGVEQVLVPDIDLTVSAGEGYGSYAPLPFSCNVPVGSRLSARYARSNANGALDVILYLVVP